VGIMLRVCLVAITGRIAHGADSCHPGQVEVKKWWCW
jgi:hypothetical protein